MSPGEPDSEVVASPESPAVTPPAHEPTPRPADAEASAKSTKGSGADQNATDGKLVSKVPPHLDRWILEASPTSAEGIAAELWHSVEAKGRWARFRENLKDLGPPISGIAAATIAFLVFYYGNQFNQRQIEIQAKQANTQRTQAETARSDLQLKILSEFGKSLSELSSTDGKTRALAAIRFVQYQSEALPAIKPALGVGEDAIRRGAVTVVTQLFLSGAVSRQELLKSLLDYFDTRNAYMRIGILESFIELDRRLSSDEAGEITALLADKLSPGADCSRQEEEEVLRQAAVFLGLWPSLQSANLLMGIAKNRSCLRARIQAVDNLPKVAQALKPENRKSIVDDLQGLVPDAPETLKQRVRFAVESIKKKGIV